MIGNWRSSGALLKQTWRNILADNILTIAGAAAYNFFFSLFPLLLFSTPILGLVGNKRVLLDWIVGRLASTVPREAFLPLRAVVEQVVFAPNAPGLISIGALLTAYSASNIFGTLMTALNIAYQVRKDNRPWWKQKLIQLAMVVVVGILLTVASIVMLGGPDLVQTVASNVGLSTVAKWGWMIMQYPLAFVFLVLAIWLLYIVLPDVPQHRRIALIGATSAAVLWVIATLLFRLYVTHFNQFNKTYGTIGAVLLLLSWMYYTMVVILAGAELNSLLRTRSSEKAHHPQIVP